MSLKAKAEIKAIRHVEDLLAERIHNTADYHWARSLVREVGAAAALAFDFDDAFEVGRAVEDSDM